RVAGLVLLLGCLLAGACARGVISPAGPATGADGLPMLPSITAAPAPDLFVTRAEAVAAALRSSGAVATYRSRLTLLGPRVIETGYPSVELKMAFGNGGIEAGADITDQGTTGEVRFADGTREAVGVVGARSALGLARQGSPGCAAVPTKPCPVVVTR